MAQSTGTKKKTNAKTAKAAPKPKKKPIRREVAGGIFAVLGILSLIGWFPAGRDAVLAGAVSRFMRGLFGYGFYTVAPMLLMAAIALLFSRGKNIGWRVTGALLMPVFSSAFIDLVFSRLSLTGVESMAKTLYEAGIGMKCGGVIGGFVSHVSATGITRLASGILFFLLSFACLLLSFNVTPRAFHNWVNSQEFPPYEPQPEPERKDRRAERQQKRAEPQQTEEPPRKESSRRRQPPVDVIGDDDFFTEPKPEPERKKPEPEPAYDENLTVLRGKSRSRPKLGFGAEEQNEEVIPAEEDPSEEMPVEEKPVEPMPEKPRRKPVGFPTPQSEPVTVHTEEVEPLSVEQAEKLSGVKPLDFSGEGRTAAAEIHEPPKKMSGKDLAAQTAEVAQEIAHHAQEGVYEKPPIFLLKKGHSAAQDSVDELHTNRQRLEEAIKSFGVNARVVDTTQGPTVTRFDVELERGVKLTKLTNLANDIALALGVVSVRIAPIPDKISTVGIEVPNKLISTVYLRDIIDSPAFMKARSDLSFAIGKNIAGEAVVGNISKLPHLLIAGTTGSGKSVCMNSLIISLLYKSTPDDVKLIMIDPKMVEMGVYNGIPHLYIPVVTDPKKAAGALQWAVTEMLKRYRLFSEIGVRGLDAYNQYLLANDQPKLPNVVVVIDELADLMLVASKDVEESICRVAQMGRAAGVHLVIATQRPSADVITGLMKANIPSRIAFAVSSGMESRIILDNVGAEKLIGMGDMLYAPLGIGKPMRVQGAFVSDEERDAIVSFIKEQSTAEYREDIIDQINKAAEDKGSGKKEAEPVSDGDKSGYDELLPQAADVIFETKQASVSMLQRRLKLGYSRAARIVDQLEEIGMLGPFEGSKPRQIIITREQWLEMQNMTGTAPIERIDPEDFDN